MIIRTTQLSLFGDPAPDTLGGGTDVQYGTREAKEGQIPRIL